MRGIASGFLICLLFWAVTFALCYVMQSRADLAAVLSVVGAVACGAVLSCVIAWMIFNSINEE
jgi:hypothetical protein